ncbi:hypothetical protein QPK32_14325 [Massilia sp. YIM B02763]|jgi:outer membrane protein, heavy metal efflux system|uniref:hypothetical protein n=1 Tax=Massilia sp. YIM B02763 TaxID=3050130 RepID=UPI0025B71D5E|nr:hypothetical protein [Massilia sp. YIM B02763]MDN4054256.1 hypothetical protein [Massilia sp. YIM B02763]
MQTRLIMLGVAALSMPLLAVAAQQSDQQTVLAAEGPNTPAPTTTGTIITLGEAIRLALASNLTLRSATQSGAIADAT